jgi:hypothetical protein
MATERQIQANRANAAKSTGPRTPEGKRISSKNAVLPKLLEGPVVLKGESMRRYKGLVAALILNFQPRDARETFLIRTMAAARWCLLRMCLAENSRSFARRHRLEVHYDRQYNQALAKLLKLRKTSSSSANSRKIFTEANSEAGFEPDSKAISCGIGELPRSPATKMTPRKTTQSVRKVYDLPLEDVGTRHARACARNIIAPKCSLEKRRSVPIHSPSPPPVRYDMLYVLTQAVPLEVQ